MGVFLVVRFSSVNLKRVFVVEIEWGVGIVVWHSFTVKSLVF